MRQRRRLPQPPNRAWEAPDAPPDEAALRRMRAFDAQPKVVQARIKEGPFNWDPVELSKASIAARHNPEGMVKYVARLEDDFREYYTPGLHERPGPDRPYRNRRRMMPLTPRGES